MTENANIMAEGAVLQRATDKFWYALVLTLPVLGLEIGRQFDTHHWIQPQFAGRFELLFATPVVLWLGAGFFRRAWLALRSGNFDMYTLIALASGLGYAYSLAVVLAPGLFISSLPHKDTVVPEYFAASAVITLFALLGQVLALKTGAKLGNFSSAERDGLHTASLQKIADIALQWFVPAAITAALIGFIFWRLLGPQPQTAHAVFIAVAVLAAACPAALALAVPLALTAGRGRGAAAGIFIRQAAALEALAKADTLVVDKTGTLTEGQPEVTAVIAAEGFVDAELLAMAAAMEQGNEHPLSRALLAAAQARGLDLPVVNGVTALAGQGVTGLAQGRSIALGNAALMAAQQVDISALQARATALQGWGATVSFMAVDGKAAGLIAVADAVKHSSAEAVAGLLEAGINVVMLTGDNEKTAAAVAETLGIKNVMAGLSPEGKAKALTELKIAGRRVMAAGDGINDAALLALADVGIALGAAPDADGADVVLAKPDLRDILRARKLAAASLGNARQNLVFALAYNAAAVPLAMGVFYPGFGLTLDPAFAALAMCLAALAVQLNALRLLHLNV